MKEIIYSLSAEKGIIGALLTNPDGCSEVFEMVSPEDFYIPDLRQAYEVIKELWEAGKEIAFITVAERLGKEGTWVVELSNEYINVANAIGCAKIVREKAILRRIVEASEKIKEIATDNTKTSQEALEEAERIIFSLGSFSNETIEHIQKYLQEVSDKLKGAITTLGYETGFKEIDRPIGGLRNGELIVVAARPSVGKTALILNMMFELAKRDKKVALFSLEMDGVSIATRLVSLDTKIPIFQLRQGGKEIWDKCIDSFAFLSSCPIYINDSPLIDPSKIRSILRRHRDVGVIFIDYIQLIRLHNEENRVLEVSKIARELKGIAREFDIPVIAISQLSRAVEQRQDKRPQLSDLRESGAIEQEADVVLLLYREDYYKKDNKEDIVPVEIEIAKNRNGPLGTVKLVFEKKTNKFLEIPEFSLEAE